MRSRNLGSLSTYVLITTPPQKSLHTSRGLPVHPVPAPAKEATVVALEATGKPSPRLTHPRLYPK